VEQPPQIDVSDKDTILMHHYNDAKQQFRSGPYFLRLAKGTQRGFEDDTAA